MSQPSVTYKRHRFPPQIIAHAVWLYYRFPLSLRLVEEMLLERGVTVSYEAIRRWGIKFGSDYARRLRRKQPSRTDVWLLDEMVIAIAGRKCWLWRCRLLSAGTAVENAHRKKREQDVSGAAGGCSGQACSRGGAYPYFGVQGDD